jgi:hypothetical protein
MSRARSPLVGVAALPAAAQCDTWIGTGAFPGTSDIVRSTATWDPDGAGPLQPVLVAAGAFFAAGASVGSYTALWNGTAWQPLGSSIEGPSVSKVLVHNGLRG